MSIIKEKWKWLILRLTSMLARVKYKTLDGCSHEQWNMSFNWIIPLKPYHFLNIIQALHRCRQFMPWGLIFSYLMNVIPYISLDILSFLWYIKHSWETMGSKGRRLIMMTLMKWAIDVLRSYWQYKIVLLYFLSTILNNKIMFFYFHEL